MSIDAFNDTVNGILDSVFANDTTVSILRLFLALYGGLAAPQVPPAWAPYLANSWIRMLVMILIIYIFNKDPATAILVAVGYYLTMHYLMKNSLAQVAQTGVVSQDIAVLISGGSGPTIKPSSVIQAEAEMMQSSVNASKATGFVVPPEAMMASGAPSTASNAGIPTLPSGTPANVSSMMSIQPETDVPLAYTPDDVHDLAIAPK